MFLELAKQLDDWMAERNLEARTGGWAQYRPCTIKILGQMALMEAGTSLTLAATKDVDVYADFDHGVKREFERLLAAEGYELDPVGNEVWMPRETRYTELFKGRFVHLLVAEPDAILLSKALKAPAKNRTLIVEYLAKGASHRFVALARKYHLDLEQFV